MDDLWQWDSCRFLDDGKVVAEGPVVFRTHPLRAFTISANGREIDMIVTSVDYMAGRPHHWRAIDARTAMANMGFLAPEVIEGG